MVSHKPSPGQALLAGFFFLGWAAPDPVHPRTERGPAAAWHR